MLILFVNRVTICDPISLPILFNIMFIIFQMRRVKIYSIFHYKI